MEIKGDLKREGLPVLFRNFATENFNGVLTISSDVGEKLITLTENEVTVYCDELNETSRIGDILLARGQITDDQLEATLRDQRKLEPRPKIGDMLVQRGYVTEGAISEARRFQIEEDICDILSWKNARFHFAGSNSAREIYPEDFSPEQVHRQTIDPDTFFKTVAKLTEGWEPYAERLPTQYLCFKLSSKTGESMSSLSKDGQKVLRLLKEGRTVEGVVKQSCIGRITVCAHVVELLEKGLILPAPGSDLRFIAAEHRSQRHNHDALYVYRRLLESATSRDEREQVENLIGEVSDLIVQQKLGGADADERSFVSHREAKHRFLQSQRRRKVFWAAFGLSSLVVLGYFLIRHDQQRPDLGQLYRDTMARVDVDYESGNFNDAMKALDELYDSIPDKESDAARNVQSKKERIPHNINDFIDRRLRELAPPLSRGGEDREQAVAALRELNEEYPGNPNEQKIKDLVKQYEMKKAAASPAPNTEPVVVPPPMLSRDELVERVKKADALKQQKKYGEALREFVSITQQAPANGDLWTQANDGAKGIKDLESKLAEEVGKAERELNDRRGDKALELVDQAIAAYGDLDGLVRAQALKTKLLARKTQAQQGMRTAREAEEQKRIFEAIYRYEQVADGYPEFPVSTDARARALALKAEASKLRKSLEAALDAVEKSDFKKARELYIPLLQFNEQLLVDQHVELPVNISSIPPGSALKVNGHSVGVTPKNVMIRAGEQYEVSVERPGFTPKRVAGDRISARDLQISISIKLDLEAVVIDLAGEGQLPVPLLAPPIFFENRLLVLKGPSLLALDPPNKEVLWSVRNLFNPTAPLPETVSPEDRNYYFCRQPPVAYKPGCLLLPLRSRELLEIDLRDPHNPVKRSLFSHLTTPPPDVVGAIHFEEHSKLAGKSLFVGAFSDGQVRCYEDVEKGGKTFAERWSQPLDPQDATRHDPPASGMYGQRGLVWALSSGGMLQAFDPVSDKSDKSVWKQSFQAMSPRSAFSSVPNDNLITLIQRNGKVILFDLDARQEVWSLPPRAAMEESVGALIDDSGVYVVSRKEDYGELSKYKRFSDGISNPPKPDWSVKLDGHVDLDMTQAKHLYLITHFNKVFAYSKSDLSPLWEFKLKPEMGDPLSIRVFGDYVYILTNKGKIIVLKSE